MRSIANSEKSPLTPLFQRRELFVEREKFPNTYKTKILLSFLDNSPFEKGGRKGFEFFTAFLSQRRGFKTREETA
jgi:hypothetical protein